MASKRLLIVDDEAVSRTIMRDVLEMARYEVAEAVDDPEGLAKAERLSQDLILLPYSPANDVMRVSLY